MNQTEQKYGWALEIEGTLTDKETGEPIDDINGQSPIEYVMDNLQGAVRSLVTPEELPFDIEFMNAQIHTTPEEAISEAKQIMADIDNQLRPLGVQITLQPLPAKKFTIREEFLSKRAVELIEQDSAWRELLALTSVNSIQWNTSEQFQGLNRDERLAVSADIYNQYHLKNPQIFGDFNLDHIGFNGLNRMDSISVLLQQACHDVFPDDLSQAVFPGEFRNINDVLDYAVRKSASDKTPQGHINSKNMHSCSIKMQGPLVHYTEFSPYAIEHRGYDSRPSLDDMLPIARYIQYMNESAISNIPKYL